MYILNRFFIRTSVMVALVHIYNLLSALNEQQTNLSEKCEVLSSRGHCPLPPPVYALVKACTVPYIWIGWSMMVSWRPSTHSRKFFLAADTSWDWQLSKMYFQFSVLFLITFYSKPQSKSIKCCSLTICSKSVIR